MNIVFSEFTNYNQYRLTLSLLPKHIWNNTSPSVQADTAITWAETNPEKIIGAGPYQLKEYFPTNGTIKIERNDFYSSWSGITPYFDEICFDTYNNLDEAKLKFLDGDIDMIDEMFGLSVVEGQALLGAASEKVISQFTTELSINMENPYFGTGELCPISSEESAKHIRKAISYIIDRDYFSNIIHSELATPAATSISPVTHGFDDSIEADPYNLTLARLEMDAAGSKISSTPPDISGISLPIILGMIALLGSAQILLIKRKR
ncbi:MAG: ABC transporter substrate-binding protein [Candidatus Heimdallarchaeota archaeon]